MSGAALSGWVADAEEGRGGRGVTTGMGIDDSGSMSSSFAASRSCPSLPLGAESGGLLAKEGVTSSNRTTSVYGGFLTTLMLFLLPLPKKAEPLDVFRSCSILSLPPALPFARPKLMLSWPHPPEEFPLYGLERVRECFLTRRRSQQNHAAIAIATTKTAHAEDTAMATIAVLRNVMFGEWSYQRRVIQTHFDKGAGRLVVVVSVIVPFVMFIILASGCTSTMRDFKQSDGLWVSP